MTLGYAVQGPNAELILATESLEKTLAIVAELLTDRRVRLLNLIFEDEVT